jgi:hypothetical protein
MSTPATNTLTQPQRPRTQTLPADYTVITPKGHQLRVRRPDGRPTRVRPSGRLLETDRVAGVQSYLHIPVA